MWIDFLQLGQKSCGKCGKVPQSENGEGLNLWKDQFILPLAKVYTPTVLAPAILRIRAT